jgi:hypothetical protein
VKNQDTATNDTGASFSNTPVSLPNSVKDQDTATNDTGASISNTPVHQVRQNNIWSGMADTWGPLYLHFCTKLGDKKGL